jgi:hypothetical protein
VIKAGIGREREVKEGGREGERVYGREERDRERERVCVCSWRGKFCQ